MGSIKRLWSPADLATLRAKLGTMPIDDLAALLNRTRATVYWKACALGITRAKDSKRKWESIEEAGRRHGMAKDGIKLRLKRAGVKFGVDGPVGQRRNQVRLLRKDVDRAVREFKPKDGRGGKRAPKVLATGIETCAVEHRLPVPPMPTVNARPE